MLLPVVVIFGSSSTCKVAGLNDGDGDGDVFPEEK
jgi:hypothetical protein